MTKHKSLSHYFRSLQIETLRAGASGGRGLRRKHYSRSIWFKLAPVEVRWSKKTLLDFWVKMILVTIFVAALVVLTMYPSIVKAQLVNPVVESKVKVMVVDIQPLPTPTPKVWNKQAIVDYIKEKFGKDADRALKIAKCESGLRPEAWGYNTNKTLDRGIFQLNTVHSKITSQCAFDPKCNIDTAYELYSRQGFGPWVCNRKI